MERKIGLSIIKINQKIDDGPHSTKVFKLGENQDIKDVHQTANKIFYNFISSDSKNNKSKNPFINKNKKPKAF